MRRFHLIQYSSLSIAMVALALTLLLLFVASNYVLADQSAQMEMSQDVTGTLSMGIVDQNGNTVSSPTLAFPGKNFSTASQNSSTILGSSSLRLRVTNPSGTNETWGLNIAATDGASAVWSNGSSSYSYNDPSGGGQMTIDPSAGTLAGVAGTATTNVSKGSADSFNKNTGHNSIDLMSASSGAPKPGQWDLTGIAVTQSIPASQATGSYSISMTLTVV